MTMFRPRTQEEIDEAFMWMALAEAREGARHGEIPIGAVVVCGGKVIARAHNMTEALGDVTAHAEMLAITSAANYLGGKYLEGCTLYVTVEPCPMCAGALAWSQIPRVVFGASDPRRGYSTQWRADRSPFHPKTKVAGGILAGEAARLMQDFFKQRR